MGRALSGDLRSRALKASDEGISARQGKETAVPSFAVNQQLGTRDEQLSGGVDGQRIDFEFLIYLRTRMRYRMRSPR